MLAWRGAVGAYSPPGRVTVAWTRSPLPPSFWARTHTL